MFNEHRYIYISKETVHRSHVLHISKSMFITTTCNMTVVNLQNNCIPPFLLLIQEKTEGNDNSIVIMLTNDFAWQTQSVDNSLSGMII